MSYIQLAQNTDTIVALASGQGGAIGVIRVSGSDAYPILDKLFKGKTPSQQAANTIVFGRIMDGTTTLDEVVLALFRGPRSYTGEDVIEISCHASPFIIRRIQELLCEQGARMAAAGEFTMRAYLNGKMDLTSAEAVAELIAAEDEQSHQIAMRQMRGAVMQNISELREQSIRLLGLLELELDFSEEDVEFADRSELQSIMQNLQVKLTDLLASYKLGNAIKQGIPVAIVGKPNAGKSTLLNQIIGDERAIVSDIEGTTRDTIEERWNCNGLPLRLIDTAGIRETTDQIEEIGVAKALKSIQQAEVGLYLFDASKESLEEVIARTEDIRTANPNIIYIANKVDLLDQAPEYQTSSYPIIAISAKQNSGIVALQHQIHSYILENTSATLSNALSGNRHIQLLEQCLQSLLELQHDIANDMPSDFLSIHMRSTLGYLGQLTGEEVGHEDVLTYIFSNFCIGK